MATQKGTQLSPAELDEKVAELSYEDARSRLVEIVARLEQGNIPLEEAMTLWELGEALARRCESWLNGARERLALAQERTRSAANDSNGSTPSSSAAGDNASAANNGPAANNAAESVDE